MGAAGVIHCWKNPMIRWAYKKTIKGIISSNGSDRVVLDQCSIFSNIQRYLIYMIVSASWDQFNENNLSTNYMSFWNSH